jgi:hypothetical protein
MSVKPIAFAGDFISGKFIKAEKADGHFKNLSPADLNDHIMTITYQLDHVDRACKAAKDAYMGWASLSTDERKIYLLKLKELFVSHEAEMAEAISRDTGKALWDATTEAKALAGKIDITLNPKKSAGLTSISVSNIKVVNHQIIIRGTNLDAVNIFNVKEGTNSTNLQIESKTATLIVANTIANVSFAAGKVFDFVLSTASAASTFTVNFSLCDSTLGG